jgi:hypothetical protein
MTSLEHYLFAMEAAPGEDATASGLVVFEIAGSATGTCGVTTAGQGLALPVPVPEAAASWRPVGVCPLPALGCVAATDGWRPAWGASLLPCCGVTGVGAFPLALDLVLPALFYTAATGGAGAVRLPPPDLAAATRMDHRGEAALSLPVPAVLAYACGLDSPVTNAAGSDAVVALLGQGDSNLSLAAAALAGGAVGDDAVAAALLAGVAGALAYVSDGDDMDVWTCAAGTYFRGTGDCEDGAILLHALLLAAGLPADRLVTTFGRVGVDRTGHAWVAYRRRGDGRWTALDWTLGASQGAVAGLPVLDEPGYYAVVDYALTSRVFFAVRQDTTVFFSRPVAQGVILPGLGIAAAGSLGADGVLVLETRHWSCLGRVGSPGRIGLPLPAATGAAGSAVVRLAFALPSACGLAGAHGDMKAPRSDVAATGGGGGLADIALASLELSAVARAALTATTVMGMGRLRAAGSGLTGLLGQADCRLARLFPRAGGSPGPVAWACPAWPRLVLAGRDGIARQGQGAIDVPPWTAAGRAGPDGRAFADYAWEVADTEEWA